jgi:Family of unknown function (DUF6272)
MTTVAGKILDQIQSVYHSILESVVHSGGNENLVFSHFGDFNQNKVDSSLQLVESAIMELGDKRQTVKRFCTILIEMLQNVSLHGSRDASGHMHSYIVVSRSAEHYRLCSGNLIPKLDGEQLAERITEVNRLDDAELRKIFIETLCNEDLSSKGGAGLGLLTIAKRIDGKIHFEIIRVSDQLSFFVMEVKMNHSK